MDPAAGDVHRAKQAQRQHRVAHQAQQARGAAFADATTRFNNQHHALVQSAKEQQAEVKRSNSVQSNTRVVVQQAAPLAGRRDENAVVKDYFTAPTATANTNSQVAPRGRIDAVQQPARGLGARPSSNLPAPVQSTKLPPAVQFNYAAAQKHIVTLTSLPAVAASASKLTRSFSLDDTADDDDLHVQAPSENIHFDHSICNDSTSSDLEQVEHALHTIDLGGPASTDALPQPLVKAASSTHLSSLFSSSSTPISLTAALSTDESHPPPSPLILSEAAAAWHAFPRRNSAARGMTSHLVLASEQPAIRAHLVKREAELAVHPDYMSQQPELNYRMRDILLDWLNGVSGRFRLKHEAVMLTASLLDRFLARRACSRDKFQLVGISCLILAAKYEEIVPPTLGDFLAVTDHAFEKRSVLHMEGVILDAVGYVLTVPYLTSFTGPLVLLCPVPAVGAQLSARTGLPRDFESEVKNLVLYYSLASVQHFQFLAYPVSLVAAAAVALAFFQLQGEMDSSASFTTPYWDEAMIETSGGYQLADLADCIADFGDILNAMSEVPGASSTPVTVPQQPKYNSITKRFQRASFDEVASRLIKMPTIAPAAVPSNLEA